MKCARWLAGAVLAFVLFPRSAGAEERWLFNGAGSFAGPISDPYENYFGGGAVGDLGAYRSLSSKFLLGARVSAGVLSHDDTVEGTVVDQGDYGLGMLSGTLRWRPIGNSSDPRRGTGLWLEAAGGGALTEGDVKPAISPGLGYVFDVGGLGIGPVGRYIHVFESSDFGSEDAQILSGGLELMFLDAPKRKAAEPEAPKGQEFQPPPPAPPLQPAARVEPDSDRDGLIDANDKCPQQPETVNGVNDHDGCPDEDKLEFIDDRLVLDERVLFPYDSFALQTPGEEKLQMIADLYKRTGGEWKKLEIKGYADQRGSQDYNYDLSRRRAKAVKSYLTTLDVPEEMLDIEAFGELDPAVPQAETEAEHRQNRRVEFVIIRE